MISCKFVSHADALFAFNLSGHAMQAKSGKDIVCAAVSAAVDLTIHLAEECFGLDVEVDIVDSEVSFIAKDGLDIADKLISGLSDYLKAVKKDYPKAITIEYLEV